MLKISIIIPMYNGALLIERCLDSVFQQCENYDKEVIVIDDGSTDNSVAIVNNYPAPIKLIKQANQGPAAARNKGIEAAKGKYLAFLDADDYWEPDFLLRTVTFLESNDAIAVSVGQIHKITGKEDRVMPQIINKSHGINEDGILLEDFYTFWATHNHVCTGSVLMRTDIVQQTGGQRPELRITEDLEFWAYLSTFGKWGFIPKVLFVSDGGKVTKSQGWWEKNYKRWASAPTTEEWASRIKPNLPQALKRSFAKAQGKIAKNLAYAMLLSNRQNQARHTALKYKAFFPKDPIAKLMSICAATQLSWFILAKLIFVRERLR